MQRYLDAANRHAKGSLGNSEELCRLFDQIETTALQINANRYAQINVKEMFVKTLLNDIRTPSIWNSWKPKVRLAALRALKVQGHERIGASALFEPDAMVLLMKIVSLLPKSISSSGTTGQGRSAFADTEWEREILKCIANIMLLNEDSRSVFSRYGGVDTAHDLFRNTRSIVEETQFVLLRILFLATVSDAAQCRRLTDVLGIAQVFEQLLKTRSKNPTSLRVIEECLKLLYNLLIHLPKSLAEDEPTPHHNLPYPSTSGSLYQDDLSSFGNEPAVKSKKEKKERKKPNKLIKLGRRKRMTRFQSDTLPSMATTDSEASLPSEQSTPRRPADIIQLKVAQRFERLLPLLLRIVSERTPNPDDPLASPVSHAVHALLHFPVYAFRSTWFPPSSRPYVIVDRLTEVLSLLISSKNVDNSNNQRHIDEPLLPLVTLHSALARGDIGARRYIKNILLPADVDQSIPVHQGDAISARIIRCLTAPYLQKSRNSVGELLFVLHDEDPEALVARVGFGNIAGYFVTCGIQIKPTRNASMDSNNRTTNTITGQRFADGRRNTLPMADATDEEKELEAERLFALFDRLNRTGVVKEATPVRQTVKEGRFVELGSA